MAGWWERGINRKVFRPEEPGEKAASCGGSGDVLGKDFPGNEQPEK
jgi:hypothetical protein